VLRHLLLFLLTNNILLSPTKFAIHKLRLVAA